MTHTLHRQGDEESLKKDYVVLAMAHKGLNSDGAGDKLRKIADIMHSHNPVNMGIMGPTKDGRAACMVRGVTLEEIKEAIHDGSILHAVYTEKETVNKVLEDIKKTDLGISIVVSGLFNEVFSILNENETPLPHTINMSLGVHGKIDLLPEPEVLEISTMCGHGLVSHNLVRDRMEKVAKGKMSAEKAAKDLASQCVCGIFNPERARELLEKYGKKF
jgi:acyl-CoA synthetase (NDP forming)